MDAKKVLFNMTYTVIMRRYGADEAHHYIIGVFDTLDKALAAGEEEREERGGKYEFAIYTYEMNKTFSKLEEHGEVLISSYEDSCLTFSTKKDILDSYDLFRTYYNNQHKRQLYERKYQLERDLKRVTRKLNERKKV